MNTCTCTNSFFITFWSKGTTTYVTILIEWLGTHNSKIRMKIKLFFRVCWNWFLPMMVFWKKINISSTGGFRIISWYMFLYLRMKLKCWFVDCGWLVFSAATGTWFVWKTWNGALFQVIATIVSAICSKLQSISKRILLVIAKSSIHERRAIPRLVWVLWTVKRSVEVITVRKTRLAKFIAIHRLTSQILQIDKTR